MVLQIHKLACKNSFPPLPLFDWADRRERASLPMLAHRISRRFKISPSYAKAVAELAGFALEARQ